MCNPKTNYVGDGVLVNHFLADLVPPELELEQFEVGRRVLVYFDMRRMLGDSLIESDFEPDRWPGWAEVDR